MLSTSLDSIHHVNVPSLIYLLILCDEFLLNGLVLSTNNWSISKHATCSIFRPSDRVAHNLINIWYENHTCIFIPYSQKRNMLALNQRVRTPYTSSKYISRQVSITNHLCIQAKHDFSLEALDVCFFILATKVFLKIPVEPTPLY